MTAPASLRLSEEARAARLYHDFHSGRAFLGYGITLTVLTICLGIRCVMEMIQKNFIDSIIIEIGQVACFGSIGVELIWQLYLAQPEDIKIREYRQFKLDLGFFVYAFGLDILAFGALDSELKNVLSLAWMVPLAIRGVLLLKIAIFGDSEAFTGVEMTAAHQQGIGE